MKIKGITLKELRQKYSTGKNGFIIKIRENTDKKQDIVYYNGIKAIEIDNADINDEEINISMADNIYKINLTNIQKYQGKIVDIIKTVRENMKEYFPMKLKKIIISKSASYPVVSSKKYEKDESYGRDNRKYIQSIIENIITELKNNELDQYFDNDFIEHGKYNIISKFDNNKSFEIELNSLEISIEEYVKIEEIFKRNAILKDYKWDQTTGLCMPEFKYVLKTNVEISNINKLFNFEKELKKTIKSYEKATRIEMEKRYQHEFMLSDNTLDKFKDIVKDDVDFYRFEEEYYTTEFSEDKDDDSGRIDCIFIDKKTNQIYMIELKVDEKVVGGTNGIHKHLIDIEKMLKDENKKINFINTLEKRYNTRRKALEDDYKEVVLDRKYVHFWTIIAFTNDKHKKVVEKMINDFNNIEYYSNVSKKGFPANSKTINEHFKSLKDLNCDARIIYDNYWNIKDLNDKPFIEVLKNEQS